MPRFALVAIERGRGCVAGRYFGLWLDLEGFCWVKEAKADVLSRGGARSGSGVRASIGAGEEGTVPG